MSRLFAFPNLGLGLGLLLAGNVIAETVLGPVAGGLRHTVKGNSDALLAFPLRRRAEFVGQVSGVQASSLTIAGLEAIADGLDIASGSLPRYYVEFGSGPLSGLVYPIISLSSGTVVLDTQGANLAEHPLGRVVIGQDVVRIRPAWSLAALFEPVAGFPVLQPVTTAPGVIYTAGDAVVLPDQATLSVDKAPQAIAAYVAGSGWRASDTGAAVDAAGRSLLPGQSWVLRRQTDQDLKFSTLGYVSAAPGVVVLPNLSAGEETDLAVGWMRPSSLSLADAGLASVLKSLSSAAATGDAVLSSANDARGMDKPTSKAERVGSLWVEGPADVSARNFAEDSGFVLRLRGAPLSRYWRQGGTD